MREDEYDREDEEDRSESEQGEEMKEETQEHLLLTEDELTRYGRYRKTGFNKGSIRKLVAQSLGQTCNPNFAIVLSGIAKVFVSEIVEEAKQVQREWNDAGTLMPSHVHEAYRRMCHRMPNMSSARE